MNPAKTKGLNIYAKEFKSMEGCFLNEQQLNRSSDDPKDVDGEKSKSAKTKRRTGDVRKKRMRKVKIPRKRGLEH